MAGSSIDFAAPVANSGPRNLFYPVLKMISGLMRVVVLIPF
jgi:hypothetical protein